MIVTWQTVLFWKVQLQVTLLAKLGSNSTEVDIQPLLTPPHGSAVNFQSVFPNVFPISSNASTETSIQKKFNIKINSDLIL